MNSSKIEHKPCMGKFRFACLCILMFLIVYSFSPMAKWQQLTTIRIAAVIIFIWALSLNNFCLKIHIGGKDADISFGKYILLNTFLLVYTTLLLLVWGKGSGYTVPNIYLNILFVSIPIFYGCKNVFHDIDEFMQALLVISLVQSVIIFASLMSPNVYSWIRTSFYYNSSFELSGQLSSMRGYALGISCFTSKGAIKLSLGLIASIYFILKRKETIKYLIMFGVISVATIAVARVGFFFSLISLVLIFYFWFVNKSRKLEKVLLSIFGLSIAVITFVRVFDVTEFISEVFWRLQVLFDQGIGLFFDSYFHGQTTVIPPLSFITFVGTGIWSGESGSGLVINADGGFFRTYFALGLIVAIIYYLLFVAIIFKGIKKIRGADRVVCILFILFIIMGEVKEPLLFEWYYQTILFIAISLYEKSATSLKKT